MEDIVIFAKEDTPFIPEVNFKVSTGHCSIEGESYLENSLEFYKPLLEWVMAYASEQKGPLHLAIKLRYFNTSSSRCLLDLFRILQEMRERGGDVTVVWHYPLSDLDNLMDGEDFMNESGLEIAFEGYDFISPS